MRCRGLQSHGRISSRLCTRLAQASCDASLRLPAREARSRRSIASISSDVQESAKPRNICAAAGFVIPDPATGTCLIHNFCHVASTIIIIVATVRNVPQILKCWRSRSAFGLSAAALATEVSCYACTVAYGIRKGYAVTLWGSELACWLQDATLLVLVARLRGARIPAMIAISIGWLALKSVLFTELVPMWFLSKFQIFVGLILGLGARVPQIVLNHQNGHTGNLALPTYIFNTVANVVCCTSTAVITGDIYVMSKEIWMFTLNATIVSQIYRTQSNPIQRAAASADLPKSIECSALQSGEFEDNFRSRSRTVLLAGNRPGGANLQSKRRAEVIRSEEWSLDSPARQHRSGVNPYSLDADKLSSFDVDDYDRSQEKNGSMDGMRPSIA